MAEITPSPFTLEPREFVPSPCGIIEDCQEDTGPICGEGLKYTREQCLEFFAGDPLPTVDAPWSGLLLGLALMLVLWLDLLRKYRRL